MKRSASFLALSLAALVGCGSDPPAGTQDAGGKSDLGNPSDTPIADAGNDTGNDTGAQDSGNDTGSDVVTPMDATPGDSTVSDSTVGDSTVSDGNVADATNGDSTTTDAGDVQVIVDGSDGGCTGPGRSVCTTPTGPACIDTTRDAEHCGACGAACAPGQVCEGSVCACPRGTALCDGRCVATAVDTNHCGACGTRCATGQSCVEGVCACPDMGAVCSGACTNPRNDNANCGGCGITCVGGSTCAASACTCPTGQSLCGAGMDARCVNPQTDDAHCGTCGNVCPNGAVCVAGACACQGGQTRCGNLCANTDSDRLNCGACGNICPMGQVCSRGACTLSCDSGRTACGGGIGMTCVDITTDRNNCGGCGMGCGAGQSCVNSMCRCETGETACGTGSAAFCIDPQNDVRNCGACNNRCARQTNADGAVCASGACRATCSTGFGDCDTMFANGCEVDLRSSVDHCGACGMACPAVPNGNRACVAGSCTAVSCAAIHTVIPSAPSGLYRVDPDGAGPNAAVTVYCDMVTAGGGWTLVGRSRPGGNLLGSCVSVDGGSGFGWRQSTGSVTDDVNAYSLNAGAIGLRFTEVLFGNYANNKVWGNRLYRHTVPADFLDGYRSRNIRIGAPAELSMPACMYTPGGNENPDGTTGSMFYYMGFTDEAGAFYFRDVDGPGFGLSASGWMTCYRNDNCYSGAVNRQQGMLMVR